MSETGTIIAVLCGWDGRAPYRHLVQGTRRTSRCDSDLHHCICSDAPCLSDMQPEVRPETALLSAKPLWFGKPWVGKDGIATALRVTRPTRVVRAMVAAK